MLEFLIQKNCPRCQATNRYWHDAGIFLVTSSASENASGGMAQAAAVICPDCGLIEFYSPEAAVLKELPRAQVPTEPGEQE